MINKEKYFEVRLKNSGETNGSKMVLSESEIADYKEFVAEVETEFTDEEIQKLCPQPLSKSNVHFIKGIKD